MGTELCWLLPEALVFFSSTSALPLPFTERAGFRTGCPDWPVVVEEEQNPHREERASGGAGGAHQGGGEEPGGGTTGVVKDAGPGPLRKGPLRGSSLPSPGLPVPEWPPGRNTWPSCSSRPLRLLPTMRTGPARGEQASPSWWVLSAQSHEAWACWTSRPPFPPRVRTSHGLRRLLRAWRQRGLADATTSRGP